MATSANNPVGIPIGYLPTKGKPLPSRVVVKLIVEAEGYTDDEVFTLIVKQKSDHTYLESYKKVDPCPEVLPRTDMPSFIGVCEAIVKWVTSRPMSEFNFVVQPTKEAHGTVA